MIKRHFSSHFLRQAHQFFYDPCSHLTVVLSWNCSSLTPSFLSNQLSCGFTNLCQSQWKGRQKQSALTQREASLYKPWGLWNEISAGAAVIFKHLLKCIGASAQTTELWEHVLQMLSLESPPALVKLDDSDGSQTAFPKRKAKDDIPAQIPTVSMNNEIQILTRENPSEVWPLETMFLAGDRGLP